MAAGYRPLPGIVDEMCDADGKIRRHWRHFVGALDQLGEAELERRFAIADRHLQDAGVSYRIYDDAVGDERPWPLSHIPLLVEEGEWAELQAGLIQRACLLEAVLADVYGAGTLVSEGRLPAAAVASNPEFLRPMVGIDPGRFGHLRFYAADIGRGPDGRWWVISDRAQAPSGLGYALENRIALARALPDLYRRANVERLAHFFQSFRGALAPDGSAERTSVCLLTPGPLNETYFEHAYLARYLGFLLVEGGDLTVRENTVYVRTVSGLKRVTALWRRLDADFADPLELNVQSQIGVPGLVRAIDAGRVDVANALGAGMVEAPGLLSFLPRLSQEILGEDLKLQNVATWWCGQAEARQTVLDSFDTMVIGPAFTPILPDLLPAGPVLGGDLDPADRARVIDAITRRGVDFVGQEAVHLSTTPTWIGGALVPRPCLLRVFLARTDEGWVVMPGAFCRVSDRDDPRAVSMQRGSRSADVWLLSKRPVRETTLLPTPANVRIERTSGLLPSRVADNMFWLGRYLERAEATLRLLRVLGHRLADLETADDDVVRDLSGLLCVWAGGDPEERQIAPERIGWWALSDPTAPGSAVSLASTALRAASVIRDRLSPDAWRALRDLEAELQHPAPLHAGGADLQDAAVRALHTVSAISGLAQENMNRLSGWRFLEIGRRVERAICTCRFTLTLTGERTTAARLDALLELVDSQITYRTRYLMAAARRPVLDLVMLDGNNPRSVAFQADRVLEHLRGLSSLPEEEVPDPPERLATRIAADLGSIDVDSVDRDLIAGCEARLMKLSDEIASRFFTQRRRAAPAMGDG